MSNPALPPLPEPHWPLQALDEIARAAVVLVNASRVWIALHDRRNLIVPHVAVASDEGAIISTDPRATPDLILSVIRQHSSHDLPAEPIAIADIHASGELVRLAGDNAQVIQAIASEPLTSEGKVIGALVIAWAQPTSFTERRRLALETFANQILMALRLTDAAERNAAQAREWSALLAASQALTGTLDPNAVFRAIIQSIQSVISCDSALIYRFDERAGQLHVISGMGQGTESFKGAVIPVSDPESKAALVARSQQRFTGTVAPTDEIGAHTDALVKGSVASLLCMPLISKGQLRGVASLARQQAFAQHELLAMERLSPIAAAALENVELYQWEHAARQQQEALFASASDGFALVDDRLTLIQVNGAFGRYLAVDPADLLGKNCCRVLGATPDPAQGFTNCLLCKHRGRCLMIDVMNSGLATDHVECEFPAPIIPDAPHASVGPALHSRTIDFSLTPVQGPQGRTHLLMVGRDVSAAREVERVRSDFIDMTSHDLRQPLHTIRGYVQHFLKTYGSVLIPEQIKPLHTAQAAAVGMTALVDDLSLLSKRNANQWTIAPQPIDLGAEARSAAEEMDLIAREKGVVLYAPEPLKLPPAMMDPRRARQVARNLIFNAIKFTKPGGYVRVSVSADERCVILRVEDSGEGIPEKELPLIWNRYYRVPRPNVPNPPRGQGIGLAIVRIIVEAHGGKKDVASEVGKGSVFTIRIPRADLPARR